MLRKSLNVKLKNWSKLHLVWIESTSADSTELKPSTGGRTYHVPLQKDDLENLTHKNFSPETMKKIKWVVKMFHEWRIYRENSAGLEKMECNLDDKSSITKENVVFAMSQFLTEVKKVDGSDFPGKTLYDTVICMQFHLETLGFHSRLLNEEVFTDVKFTLDNMMKLCTSQGIGVSVKKAQFLSHSDEDLLWSLGLLGTHSPESLLTTIVFIMGKGCALGAGKEHHALRSLPFSSQISFLHDDQAHIFMRYKEDIGLKTNKGGIKHKKIEPKELDVYLIENIDRCPVQIVLKYLSLLPKNRVCTAFYLQPRKKFRPNCWFLDRPAGINRLRDTVKETCKKAGLPGFYSNHSLRSTAASGLYRSNIDEQIIQEITQHRSLAVRSYKRTSDSQHRYASNCLFATQ